MIGEVDLDFSYLHGDAFSPTRNVYSSDVRDDEWEFAWVRVEGHASPADKRVLGHHRATASNRNWYDRSGISWLEQVCMRRLVVLPPRFR